MACCLPLARKSSNCLTSAKLFCKGKSNIFCYLSIPPEPKRTIKTSNIGRLYFLLSYGAYAVSIIALRYTVPIYSDRICSRRIWSGVLWHLNEHHHNLRHVAYSVALITISSKKLFVLRKCNRMQVLLLCMPFRDPWR